MPIIALASKSSTKSAAARVARSADFGTVISRSTAVTCACAGSTPLSSCIRTSKSFAPVGCGNENLNQRPSCVSSTAARLPFHSGAKSDKVFDVFEALPDEIPARHCGRALDRGIGVDDPALGIEAQDRIRHSSK